MLAKLKRYFPKSLFGRTLLIMILPVIIAQAVAVYMFYERHWQNVSKHLASSLSGEISLVVNYVENVEDPERIDSFLDSVKTLFGMHVMSIKEARANKYLESYLEFDHPQYYRSLSSKINNKFEFYQDRKETEIATKIYLGGNQVLLITISDKRLINSTTYIFIFWMIGTTAILFSIALIFLKNQIRPIIRLARLANSFGRGHDVSNNFKPEGAEEIRQAGAAFLNMKERITRHIKQRTEMLAGISHDLRTPLTRMKLEIAMLGEKYDDDNIDELSKDIEEMEEMVTSYINFVKADEEEETKEVNLEHFLIAVLDKFRQQDMNVTLHSSEEVIALVRENALRRAFVNLLENSKKYADKTKVNLEKEMGFVIITIEDNGPGIPDEELEEVFRPFHRVDNSRNRETGGTGLGLSIVRDIINGHGGNVVLSKVAKGNGLKAVIKLPI